MSVVLIFRSVPRKHIISTLLETEFTEQLRNKQANFELRLTNTCVQGLPLKSFPERANKRSELWKQDAVFQSEWGWRYDKGHRLEYRLFFYVYQVEDKPVCPFPLPSRCWTPGRKWHHEGWQRFGAMACSSPQFSGAHTLWSWSLSTSTGMMERTTNPNLNRKCTQTYLVNQLLLTAFCRW